MKNVMKLPSAQDFRAQSTGMGQTLSESRRTGMNRAQCAIDCAPASAKAKAETLGFPKSTEQCLAEMGVVMQTPLVHR